MENQIPIFSGPIAVIDMLGFGDFVKCNQLRDVIDAYARIITGASFTSEVLTEELQFMIYSDTIAIRLVNTTETGFYNFIRSLQLILHKYFYTNKIPGYLNIPIRGAIVSGDYSWHKGDISTQVMGRKKITATAVNFIVGEPIIRAHNHEESQKWIGISFDPESKEAIQKSFPSSLERLITEQYLVEYPVPQVSSCATGLVINPTCRATFQDEFSAFMEKCKQIIEQIDPCPDVVIKYKNTLVFLRYLFDKNYLIPMLPSDASGPPININTDDYAKLLKEMEACCGRKNIYEKLKRFIFH